MPPSLGVPPPPLTIRTNNTSNNPLTSTSTSKPLIRPRSTISPRSNTSNLSNRDSYQARSTSPTQTPQTQPHPQRNHSKYNSLSSGPKEEDLLKFRQLCENLYYKQDSGAAQSVDATLQRLPAAFRTAYARTMANVRQEFHLHESIRRRKEVEDSLFNSLPNSKIMSILGVSSGGTIALRSPKARKARYELHSTFLSLHCVKGLPGTIPFLKSLYATLYLQGNSATSNRVIWEIDVNVFTEAGGGTWMNDSIEILKSVLGFEECIQETALESYFDEDDDDLDQVELPSPPPFITSDNEASDSEDVSEPLAGTSNLSMSMKRQPPTVPPHRSTSGSIRTRAPSDPFLDPKDAPTSSLGPLSPTSSPSTTKFTPTPSTPFLSDPSPISSIELSLPSTARRAPLPQIRIFTLPAYITDPELRSLSNLFPDFITSKSKPKPKDIVQDEESSIGFDSYTTKVGHGEIKIGNQLRDEGWRGTRWERFKTWFFSCFGR